MIAFPKNDLTGKIFNAWTVLGFAFRKTYSNSTVNYWNVRCECGHETQLASHSLKQGTSKRCQKCKGRRLHLGEPFVVA